jgi:hypothetical protein
VAKIADICAAIDAFMAAEKRIVGAHSLPTWAAGYNAHERQMKYPLEVGGEQHGAQLMVVGFPREPNLKFRLGILFPAMICRLDYTDESHTNTLTGALSRSVPFMVHGPHYHSWPLNRRHFHGVTVPPKLLDAAPYNGSGRTFDAVLRWFCADTNIQALPPDHRIELPIRERLV